MSHNPGYNPEWWKEAKAASRARRKAPPSGKFANPGDSFLVVTEGDVTEPEYFEQFKRKFKRLTVKVKVAPSDHSDALSVIECAANLKKEHETKARRNKLSPNMPQTFDHVWAVIDTDAVVSERKWPEALALAKKLKVNIAHSTPCFEFWLLLHLAFTTRTDLIDCGKVVAAIKKELQPIPYSKSKEDAPRAIGKIVEQWRDAIRHAQQVRQHHIAANTKVPASPSTEVDQIVSAILEAAPPYLRPQL